MRLKRLYIKEFRNLKDFEVEFHNGQLPHTVIVGKNGAGKSNLMEAIYIIFETLYNASPKNKPPFAFEVEYEIQIERYSCHIHFMCNPIDKPYYSFRSEHLLTSDYPFERKSIPARLKVASGEEIVVYVPIQNYKDILPQNILSYYSGINDRLCWRMYKPTNQYIRRIRQNEQRRFRVFLSFAPVHYRIIFLALLSSQLRDVRLFLLETLKITTITKIVISIKKPKGSKSKDRETFWDAPLLLRAMFHDFSFYGKHLESKKINQITYEFSWEGLSNLIQNSEIRDEVDFFRLLDEAYLLNYLNSITVCLKRNNIDRVMSFESLSEGEQQLIAIRGITELLRDSEMLFLLDEPDTYLHPDWQRELMQTLSDETSRAHYLVTTHSPQVLSMVHSENIMLLDKGKPFTIDSATINRDSNAILEEVFDISPRPPGIEERIQAVFKCISQGELEQAEQRKSELAELLNSEDPIFIQINASIHRKRLLGK